MIEFILISFTINFISNNFFINDVFNFKIFFGFTKMLRKLDGKLGLDFFKKIYEPLDMFDYIKQFHNAKGL